MNQKVIHVLGHMQELGSRSRREYSYVEFRVTHLTRCATQTKYVRHGSLDRGFTHVKFCAKKLPTGDSSHPLRARLLRPDAYRGRKEPLLPASGLSQQGRHVRHVAPPLAYRGSGHPVAKGGMWVEGRPRRKFMYNIRLFCTVSVVVAVFATVTVGLRGTVCSSMPPSPVRT